MPASALPEGTGTARDRAARLPRHDRARRPRAHRADGFRRPAEGGILPRQALRDAARRDGMGRDGHRRRQRDRRNRPGEDPRRRRGLGRGARARRAGLRRGCARCLRRRRRVREDRHANPRIPGSPEIAPDGTAAAPAECAPVTLPRAHFGHPACDIMRTYRGSFTAWIQYRSRSSAWAAGARTSPATSTSCPDANLKYVCDLDQKKLDALARQFPGSTLTRDFDAVLRDPEVQAVVIATPAPRIFRSPRWRSRPARTSTSRSPSRSRSAHAEQLIALAATRQARADGRPPARVPPGRDAPEGNDQPRGARPALLHLQPAA